MSNRETHQGAPGGQASNADGSVTVAVDPAGIVIDLRLSPLAMRRSHLQLQQEILDTMRQAAAPREVAPPVAQAPGTTPPPRPTAHRKRTRAFEPLRE